jgi:hypothetical protein
MKARVEINVMDVPVMREFLQRVEDFIQEYAWHSRDCAAIDADGSWHRGNPACDCGYDDARAALIPDEPAAAVLACPECREPLQLGHDCLAAADGGLAVTADRLRDDGRWLPAEPSPEPFGVLWGRLWHERRRSGEAKWIALFTSWLDARAVAKVGRGAG